MKTTPQIELVQSLYAAFSRGDTKYITDRVADGASWVCHGEKVVPWVGEYRGKDQVARFFAAIAGAADVELFEPKEFISQGDRVVSIGVFGAKVKATGKSVRTKWIFVWTVQNGLVKEYEQWHDEGLAVGFGK